MLTGDLLAELLEAAASGAEMVEGDGLEVAFAETLRSLADRACEHGGRGVDIEITLRPSGASDEDDE